MKKTGLLVQARMTSTRLPGKVLMDILGEPMIVRVMERVRRCRLTGDALIVTSDDVSDDPLCAVLNARSIPFFRGSLHDVLSRYFHAAKKLGLDTVVRVTGDCPLVDPQWLDRLVERLERGGYDAVFCADSVPDGFRAHVLTYAALEKAFQKASLNEEREHVVPYLWNHPQEFRVYYESYPQDLSACHLSVDTQQDLERVRALYELLYRQNPMFTLEDVAGTLAGIRA